MFSPIRSVRVSVCNRLGSVETQNPWKLTPRKVVNVRHQYTPIIFFDFHKSIPMLSSAINRNGTWITSIIENSRCEKSVRWNENESKWSTQFIVVDIFRFSCSRKLYSTCAHQPSTNTLALHSRRDRTQWDKRQNWSRSMRCKVNLFIEMYSAHSFGATASTAAAATTRRSLDVLWFIDNK